MSTPKLKCPHAKYKTGMKIWCKKAGDFCGHVQYKLCKGWWEQTEGAAACPMRREQEHGNETTAGGRD